ncbi:hypothetical protein AKJ16_DCAP19311, partial [Drosera capensis]
MEMSVPVSFNHFLSDRCLSGEACFRGCLFARKLFATSFEPVPTVQYFGLFGWDLVNFVCYQHRRSTHSLVQAMVISEDKEYPGSSFRQFILTTLVLDPSLSSSSSSSHNGAKVIIGDIQDDLVQMIRRDIGSENVSYVHCDVTKDSI